MLLENDFVSVVPILLVTFKWGLKKIINFSFFFSTFISVFTGAAVRAWFRWAFPEPFTQGLPVSCLFSAVSWMVWRRTGLTQGIHCAVQTERGPWAKLSLWQRWGHIECLSWCGVYWRLPVLWRHERCKYCSILLFSTVYRPIEERLSNKILNGERCQRECWVCKIHTSVYRVYKKSAQ